LAKLKKLLTNINPQKIANMKVAALCFLAAATFWVLNALNKGDYNTVVDYPIAIVFDESEFMPVEQLPNRIKIEINGNGWDLLRKYFQINESPFLIEINNPSNKDFIVTSDLRRTLADNISPSGLVSIVTDTVKFKIDEVVTRKVKIEVDTTATSLAQNFKYGSGITIDPPFVDIKGPTSVLQELDGVLKVKLGEEKINKDFNKLIPVVLPSAYTDFLTLSDESVQIKFEVYQMLEGNKRLKIKMVNFPKNVSLAQEPTNIIMSYFIDERKVAELSKYEFEAILNYNNRDQEDSTIFVELRPKASFLEKIKFEPEVLKLKYEKP
jgi:YbbR domain-containing protein